MDIGSADLQKKSRHPNLNRIWSLSDFHLNRKLPESCPLRNLHRCVFLFQTVSVLKYLIPADRTDGIYTGIPAAPCLTRAGGTTKALFLPEELITNDLRKRVMVPAAIIKLYHRTDNYVPDFKRLKPVFTHRAKHISMTGSGILDLG